MNLKGKAILMVASLMITLWSLGLLIQCTIQSMLRGGDIEDIAVFVPNDVDFFFASRGIGETYFEFAGIGDAIENAGERTEYYLEKIRADDTLGFDFMSPEDWDKTGLSFFRPLGISVTGKTVESTYLTFYLPIRSGKKNALLGTLNEVFENLGKKVEVRNVDGHDLHIVQDLIDWFPVVMNYAAHDGYVIGILGMDGSFPVPPDDCPHKAEPDGAEMCVLDAIWNMKKGDSLMESQAFKNRLATVGNDWHSLSYLSATTLKSFTEMLNDMTPEGLDTSALPLADSSGIAITNTTDTRVQYRAAQRFNSKLVSPEWLRKVKPRDTLGDKIPGKPLITVRASVNLPAIWDEFAPSNAPGAQPDLLSGILEEGLDIDLKRDVAENLYGSATAVIFEPNFAELLPELVGYMPLRDSQPIEELVDTACRLLSLWGGRLEKDEHGGLWCTEPGLNIFVGVAHNHILYGIGKDPKQYQVLESNGFKKQLPPIARKELDNGEPIFAYVDLKHMLELAHNQKDELGKLLGSDMPDLPPTLPIRGLSIGAELKKSKAENSIEKGLGGTPHDGLIEINALAERGSITEWLRNDLEGMVVWTEKTVKDFLNPPTESVVTAVTGLKGTMDQIVEWQIVGQEELGAPYVACGNEEKANLLVNGGNPDTVYSDEDRACFENIGWTPAAGTAAFWTEIKGSTDAPTGFTVHGIENTADGIQRQTQVHPSP